MSKIPAFFWTCDKCGHKETHTVHRKPPEGWIELTANGYGAVLCPACVDVGVGRLIEILEEAQQLASKRLLEKAHAW
jgi:hypothetical protein